MALLNFAHGLYLVSSRDWCYTDSMAPSTAVRFALIGAQRDKVRPLLRPAKAPLFAGLPSRQGDGEGGYTWDAGGEGGQVVAAGPDTWRIWVSDSARAAVRIGKRIELKVAVSGKVLKSPVLRTFGQEPLLAWAARKTAQLVGRRD